MFYTAIITAGYDGIKRDPGHSVLLDVFGELRAKRPCSLYRWASVRCILMEGEEERLLAAEPHERILQDARVAIPAMESGRTSEAVAHDIVVAARGSLSLASALPLWSAFAS